MTPGAVSSFFLSLALFLPLLCGCAGPIVAVRSDYDFQNVKEVALLGFEDFPSMPGSGLQVSSVFEKVFLGANVHLVERRQADAILREQNLDLTGALDSQTTAQLGKLLGVDALVLGTLTVYTPERKSVEYVDLQLHSRQPVYATKTEMEKQGDKMVRVQRTYIEGYTSQTQNTRIPETYALEAEVGVAVRMVDVKTGEVLWVGSSSEEAVNTGVASEILANRIVKALKNVWPAPLKKGRKV